MSTSPEKVAERIAEVGSDSKEEEVSPKVEQAEQHKHPISASKQLFSSSSSNSPAAKGSKVKGRKKSNSKKPTQAKITEDPLITSMHYLSRWDLDAVPLVSRRFGNAAKQSSFPQRRVIDQYIRQWGCLADYRAVPYGLNTISVGEKTAHQLKKHFPECTLDKDYEERSRVKMGEEDFARLLKRSPDLRARKSMLMVECDRHDRRSDKLAQNYAALWDGGVLELNWWKPPEKCPPPLSFKLTAALVGKCAELQITTLRCGYVWDGAPLGSVTSGTRNCPLIDVDRPCWNTTYEDVLEYAFASTADGKKRVLKMPFWYPDHAQPNFTVERLKGMITERLARKSTYTPIFSLTLWVYLARGENPPHKEQKWELTAPPPPQQQSPSPSSKSHSTGSSSLSSPLGQPTAPCKCSIVTNKYEFHPQLGMWMIIVKVECS